MINLEKIKPEKCKGGGSPNYAFVFQLLDSSDVQYYFFFMSMFCLT